MTGQMTDIWTVKQFAPAIPKGSFSGRPS